MAEPTADSLFDEIMATLEVGTTYICPEAVRTTPAEVGPSAATPPPLSEIRGEPVDGGQTVQYGNVSFYLPEGRQYIIGAGVGGPGPFWTIHDVRTRSSLGIRPPGCESSRFVRDPEADAVFDEIVATLQGAPPSP